MTTIDETTGLPELPEGLFWRITPLNIIGMHEIQVRKKRFIGSTKVSYGQVSPGMLRPDTIHASAVWALERASNSGMKYVGDYPPKKLSA